MFDLDYEGLHYFEEVMKDATPPDKQLEKIPSQQIFYWWHNLKD
jgi:hypothetical protein